MGALGAILVALRQAQPRLRVSARHTGVTVIPEDGLELELKFTHCCVTVNNIGPIPVTISHMSLRGPRGYHSLPLLQDPREIAVVTQAGPAKVARPEVPLPKKLEPGETVEFYMPLDTVRAMGFDRLDVFVVYDSLLRPYPVSVGWRRSVSRWFWWRFHKLRDDWRAQDGHRLL